MKKRLLTTWLIACMMISLVGQTPLVALAEGDDTRVIPVPEGLQELLVSEVPETPTVQDENIVVEIPETITEQDENVTVDNTDTEIIQDEIILEDTPGIELVQNEENVVEETTDFQNVQDDNTVEETPITQIAQSENIIVETTECIERTVDAELPQGALNYGDIVRVSGLMPKDAIVEAIPVNVEIEGQSVLLAYDITIYENEEKKNAGTSWQPGEEGLSVEFISSALETTEEEVNIWHMEDTEETPEYVTAAPSPYGSVEFVAESFSVYVVTSTKLTATIVASDGNTYEINVTYTNQSGIPMDGTKLAVSELKSGDEGYDEYIEESASKVGTKAEDLEFSKVFDIKIVDENDEAIEYEPTGDVDVSIRVIGVSLSEYPQVNVLHFVEDRNDENFLVYDVDSTVNGESVEFTTDSFSVYVIVGHEGGDIETPRITINFLAPVTDIDSQENNENGIYSYTVGSFSFLNKAGDWQTTQIVQDGETLERISNPPNLANKFFFGWYIVNVTSKGADYTFRWTASPKHLPFDIPIGVSDNGDGTFTMSWTVDGELFTETAEVDDTDYSAHIYVAPIYQDYCFVNFHELAYAVSNNSNLLTRKLVILGDDGVENVLISDVSAQATDTIRRIFRGWQYRTNDTWISVQTMDNSANVIRKTIDVTGDTDLYPYFQEGRWIYYNVGDSGNGAKYVPAQFNLAEFNTQDGGASVGGNITSLPTTNRVGYEFGGWRVIVNNDTENPQFALISDSDGNILSNFTYTDKDGNAIAPPVGCTDTLVSVNESYLDNDLNVLTGVAFTVQNGVLTIKYPLSSLTLYALWTEKANAPVSIVIWKQKTADSPDATDDEKTYDYYALSESVLPSVVYRNSGLLADQLGLGAYEGLVTNNATKDDFVGFVYSRTEMSTPKVRGDGSTVVNVYYDRITYNLKFVFARIQTDAAGNNTGNYYVPTLDGSFNPPSESNKQTWQAYCTEGSGLRWDSVGTSNLASICTYPSDKIQSEVYKYGNNNSYRYYFYVIKANYGQDISEEWPGYSYFPIVGSRTLTSWWRMRGTQGYIGPGQNDTVKGLITTIDKPIIGRIDDGDGNFLIASYRGSTPNNWTYNIYLEKLDGVDYSGYTSETRNGREYYLASSFLARSSSNSAGQQNAPAYTGFTEVEHTNPTNLTMNYYYKRLDYTFTFDYNYPVEVGLGDKKISPPDTIYYQASLADYNYVTNPTDLVNAIRPSDSEIPDHYEFLGWFEDAKGTKEFSFNTTMPAADKIVYGKWEAIYYSVLVDPNGGVIDHINYSESMDGEYSTFYLDGFTPANSSDAKWIAAWDANGDRIGSMPSWATILRAKGNGHKTSQSTYFSARYGTAISEYELERKYVEFDGEDDGTKLYYVNMQFNSTSGEWGLHSDMRNALYLTATQLEAYYKYCKAAQAWHNVSRPGYYDGTIPDTLEDFKDLYVKKKNDGSFALYEERDSSSYAFVGWYVVDDNGTISDNPYSFANAVEGPISLRAIWRKIGSFYISYDPVYILNDNGNTVTINGIISAWTDPVDVNSENYNDGATTTTLQQPTGITVNGFDAGDNYIFRGWQVVGITLDTNGNTQYTPLHPGVYYPEPTVFVIDASDADSSGCIHMQAVYQSVNESDLRPEVANLMLNANDGFITTNGGSSRLASDEDITVESGWGVGTVIEDESENEVVFGDMQSNDAVHLYKYAIRQGAMDPPYDNSGLYFYHPNHYLLIGFDEKSDYTHKLTEGNSADNTDNPYVPHYAADAVISVQRTDSERLYAVWEPMVYVTFTNRTKQPVTFTVSGEEAMKVVNEVTGLFSREKFTETTITLAKDESIKLVMPEGADKSITINGTNTNTAQLLSISSYHQQEDAAHLSGTTTAGTYRSSGATYNLSDTLIEDKVGVLVFFEGEDTVFYDVNGGAWTDTSRTGSDRNTVINNNSLLFVDEDGLPYAPLNLPVEAPEPTEPTRAGYKFVGWTVDEEAAKCDPAGYTLPGTDPTANINNMAVINNNLLWDFSEIPTEGMTLYAIWGEEVTVTFHLTANHTWQETNNTDYVPGNNRTYVVTLAKGDTVNSPISPKWANNDSAIFYRWANDNSHQGAIKNVGEIDNIYNFGIPVTNNLDLYTSWIQAKYIDVDISKIVSSRISEDEEKYFNFKAVVTTTTYTGTASRGRTNWSTIIDQQVSSEEHTFTLKHGDRYLLPLYYLDTASTTQINNSNGSSGTATIYYQSVTITESSDPNFEISIKVNGISSDEAIVSTIGTAPSNVNNNQYGWSYVTGNNNRRTYTLHSIPKYSANTNPAAEVPVVFTNTRDKTDVKVTKIVTPDDYLTGDETFNFTATYKDSYNQTVTPPALTGYDAYGYAVNGNTASFALKDGQEFILRGVPIDGSVTVTETAIGWTATSVNDNDSNDTDGATFTLSSVPITDGGITFTNARDTYDVTVTNQVAPDPYGDKTKPFTYTATLWDGDTQVVFPSTITDVTFTNGRKNMTFTLKHEQEYIIRNLPGGYKLVVTQTEDADYEIESTGKQIANNIAITDGDTANDNIFIISAIGVDAQIDFVNTLKKGQYTITKHVQLEAGQTMPENKTFDFTVRLLKTAGSQNPEEINTELKAAVEAAGATVTDTDNDGKYDAILFSFTHDPGNGVDLTSVDGAEITLTGLPVGHFLQVTETALGYAAYINNIRTESTTVQIAEGDNGNINYINRPASSILKIQKTDALDSSPIQGAKFRLYNVKGGNQNTLFTLTSDNDGWLTYTESGNVNNVLSLENGTYYMVETDAPNGYRKSADVITIVVNNSETNPQDRIKLGTGSVGTLTWTSETEPFILTVTNERVDIAPTNYSNKFLPFALIFMVSLLLCSTPIIAKMRKREEEY
ncbi:MAG: InlB B-repeat-containing protein [Lachnospiraceae bacterium]|nr:InlB B-repeat-containing protein [Lachnospiraceae bacterium]